MLKLGDDEAAPDAKLVVLFKNEKPEEAEVGTVENEVASVVVAVPTPVVDAAGNENPGEPDTLTKENPGAEEAELEKLAGAANDVVVEEGLNEPNRGAVDELKIDEEPVRPKVEAELDPNEGAFPREPDAVANENPGAELEALVVNGGDVDKEEELKEPNKLAGDEPNMDEDEPERPKVDPELDPNGVFPIDATVAENDGVEGANRPPAGDLPSNTGSVEAEVVDAAVVDPNTVEPGIRPNSDRGAVFAAFDADRDDPNWLDDEDRPDPNDGAAVLLLEAPEENPNGLEDGALPNPDKFEDPGAGDANTVEVPNGDDEGDGDPAAVAEVDPNMLAV